MKQKTFVFNFKNKIINVLNITKKNFFFKFRNKIFK